jgi:hypothetical protein
MLVLSYLQKYFFMEYLTNYSPNNLTFKVLVPLSTLPSIHDLSNIHDGFVYSSGKGVYGFLTGCQVRSAGGFDEKSSSFPAGERIISQKT